MKRLVFCLLIAGTSASGWAEETSVYATYLYQSLGKRDPFQPPPEVKKQLATASTDTQQATPQRIKEPLESFQLDSLKLVAILRSSQIGEAAAMVQDPVGKGYLVRKEYYIGTREGQIIDIQDGIVTIQEPPQSKSGTPKIITLRMHEEKAK